MEQTEYKKASFLVRFAAFLIDSLLLLALLFPISLALKNLQPIGFLLIEFILISTYNTFFIYKTGATIGKRLLRIEVVGVIYERPSIKQVLIREVLGKYVSRLLFGLGFLLPLYDNNRQALHDKLAKTLVINKNTQSNQGNGSPSKIEKVLFFIISVPIVLSVILGVFFGLVARPIKVAGNGMLPTYKNGDYLAVRYPFNIAHQDIVVYQVKVKGEKIDIATRVIGIPNDTVTITKGAVYINGKQLKENTYLSPNTITVAGKLLSGKSIKVPEDHYFVLGDNRVKSTDSRQVGFLPRKNIVGKVWFCVLNCTAGGASSLKK